MEARHHRREPGGGSTVDRAPGGNAHSFAAGSLSALLGPGSKRPVNLCSLRLYHLLIVGSWPQRPAPPQGRTFTDHLRQLSFTQNARLPFPLLPQALLRSQPLGPETQVTVCLHLPLAEKMQSLALGPCVCTRYLHKQSVGINLCDSTLPCFLAAGPWVIAMSASKRKAGGPGLAA